MDFYNKDLSSFFDESGKNYDPPLAEMKELLLSYLTPEIIKDKIILDAGCGIGLASLIFGLWSAKEVVGLDISAASIQKAEILKKKYQADKVKFLMTDLDKIGWPDNYFDFIFSRGVSFYASDLKSYLNKLAKITKPNGFLIIDFVRATKITYLTEKIRKIFRLIPRSYHKKLSQILSFISFPLIKMLLGKKAKLVGGKNVEQMFYEHFFSPIEMKTTSIDEIKIILGPNYLITDLNVPNIGLHSPKTSFYLKIIKKSDENTLN